MKFKESITKFNDRVALAGTKWFGTMAVFWLFFVWGLIGMMPFIPADMKNLILLISSAWIQLWALPLLAVGTAVLNRASEKRAMEDHQHIKQEFAEIKLMHQESAEILKSVKEDDKTDRQILARLDAIETLLAEIKAKHK